MTEKTVDAPGTEADPDAATAPPETEGATSEADTPRHDDLPVADLAAAHVDSVMPDQTYLQQAQPSTFGHYVLSFAYPTLRDSRRLLEALEGNIVDQAAMMVHDVHSSIASLFTEVE